MYDLKLIADIVLIAERERSGCAAVSIGRQVCVCLQGEACGEFRGLGVAFGPGRVTQSAWWTQRGEGREGKEGREGGMTAGWLAGWLLERGVTEGRGEVKMRGVRQGLGIRTRVIMSTLMRRGEKLRDRSSLFAAVYLFTQLGIAHLARPPD
jgi:hypothetical protein